MREPMQSEVDRVIAEINRLQGDHNLFPERKELITSMKEMINEQYLAQARVFQN